MTEPNREATLDRLTEPLQDDPELRLDVRAELAAHIDDKVCELREQGAAAVMTWSAVSRPWLVHQEEKLIRRDTLITTPSEGPIGFTGVEARLTQRLKRGVAEAAKRLEAGRGR